ncbi:cytosol aminopeptidase-like [Phlebotomus argentipes]|uniref:cytosol aminopeptidase-like n=1 Tax=Phlebotomus argentipes TaxID=94469 RepID=UPI0028933C4A|nr:cytosol aminopeptidase-like [Phlebotomus argentipes]
MFLLNRLRRASRGISRPSMRLFASFPSQADAPMPSGATKGIVVGIYEHPEKDYVFTECGEEVDGKLRGRLKNEIERCGLKGKSGEVKVLNGLSGDFYSVAIVGLGTKEVGFSVPESLDMGLENVRVAAALGALKLRDDCVAEISLDPMGHPEEVAEGATLALWEYQDNRRVEDRQRAVALECYNCLDEDAWTRGLFKAEAQNLARKLAEAPANQLTPTIFAQVATDSLCPCGVTLDVRGADWIAAQRMTAFMAVARSSCEPPALLEVNYAGSEPGERPIVLVGSGITFNSGGLCLKSLPEMEYERATMSGAAVVMAAVRAAAALSLPINIRALIPLCENMPSGMSFKVGDVFRCSNGKSVAVHDTGNAETLIMADAFAYAMQIYKPRLVMDLATMTRKGNLLGSTASSVFTNSDAMWKELQKAGAITGDRVWRFPLWKTYTRQISNFTNYDLSNRGDGQAYTCRKAAFLKEFIGDSEWIHMDIGEAGLVSPHNFVPYYRQGKMTGRPTRALIQFLYQLACPEQITDLREM